MTLKKILAISLLLGMITYWVFQSNKSVIIIPGHAHNDYEHLSPLMEALEYKFKSLEVDVFSSSDSLFIAHDSIEIQPGITLRNLYLDKLAKIVSENNGSVYGEGTELILLVDIKDDGLKTYKVLHKILESYKHILTSYNSGVKSLGAISIIVSGNRPIDFILNQPIRYASYDGRISDLDSGIDASFMPLVSDNWQRYFKWDGEGEMLASEEDMLFKMVQKAHKNGYMVRFWGTPDEPGVAREEVWNKLIKAQVDLIGSDDLKGLQTMFLGL